VIENHGEIPTIMIELRTNCSTEALVEDK